MLGHFDRQRQTNERSRICTGIAKQTGRPCRHPVPRGSDKCIYHRRSGFAFKADKDLTPKQLARRQASRLQRRWNKDPWEIGSTITLTQIELASMARKVVPYIGRPLASLAPGDFDWICWRWRVTITRRNNQDEWRDKLAQLPARIAFAERIRALNPLDGD